MLHLTRRLTAVAIACCLLTAATCNKTTLVSSATDVLQSLTAAQPLIEQFLPKAKDKIAQGINIATKLKDAIAANNSTGAAEYLADLIPVFQAIVRDDIPQIHDPNVRTSIMVALSLADIALHFIINHTPASPAMASALPDMKAKAVAYFAAEKVWGEAYKKK